MTIQDWIKYNDEQTKLFPLYGCVDLSKLCLEFASEFFDSVDADALDAAASGVVNSFDCVDYLKEVGNEYDIYKIADLVN